MKNMVRLAKDTDYTAVRSLWGQAFPGYEGFTNYFFSNVYTPARTLVELNQGRLVCMLQMFEYELQLNKEQIRCGYIYGAATDREYRGRGHMKRLLKNAHHIMKAEGYSVSVTIPENEGLFGYYKQFGYVPAFYLNKKRITPSAGEVQPEPARERIGDLNNIYEKEMVNRTYILRTKQQWTDIIGEAVAEGGDICIYRDSYIIYTADGDTLLVSEAMGMQSEILAADTAARLNCRECICVRPAGDKSDTPFACIKLLTRKIGLKALKLELPPYANLLHN